MSLKVTNSIRSFMSFMLFKSNDDLWNQLFSNLTLLRQRSHKSGPNNGHITSQDRKESRHSMTKTFWLSHEYFRFLWFFRQWKIFFSLGPCHTEKKKSHLRVGLVLQCKFPFFQTMQIHMPSCSLILTACVKQTFLLHQSSILFN